ncbi:MAG: FHA domain-containing protein [Chroococcales cyanobacterium]
MAELTLEWHQSGHRIEETIFDQQASKHPGTVRLGRDPARCDLILSHPTVSGLHVEIFFDFQQQQFFLRNLRKTNPPVVDGHQLTEGEVPIHKGSAIYLGQMVLNVTSVSLPIPESSIPQTILIPPDPNFISEETQQPTSPPSAPTYGLQCPRCSRISSYDRIDFGCPWCGTSLAAAASILIPEES